MTEASHFNANSPLKTYVRIGLFTALIYVATMIGTPIPGMQGGYLHFGTVTASLIALTFGPFVGMLSSAIGMTLFDILSGFSIWAPGTFFTRLVAGLVIGFMARHSFSRHPRIRQIIALTVGNLLVVLGYFLWGWLVVESMEVALQASIFDLINAAFSILVSFTLYPFIEHALPTISN